MKERERMEDELGMGFFTNGGYQQNPMQMKGKGRNTEDCMSEGVELVDLNKIESMKRLSIGHSAIFASSLSNRELNSRLCLP